MNAIAKIDNTKVEVINFKSVPVLTTVMLAEFYGTDDIRIQQNHIRNKGRFVEGKHFYKLEGTELKAFKQLTSSKIVSKNARSLTLWTERGASRHAKMLDTDQAWDVFEKLEECYFTVQEIKTRTKRTTKDKRTALHQAIALLMTKVPVLNFKECYQLIHQRFNVDHLDEIPEKQLPEAVGYIHSLISGSHGQPTQQAYLNKDVQFLMYYVPKLGKLIRDEIYPALTAIQSNYAGHIMGLSQEATVHANVLCRYALKDGVTHLEHVGERPVHTVQWYLEH